VAIANLNIIVGLQGKIGGGEYRLEAGRQIIQSKPNKINSSVPHPSTLIPISSTVLRAWKSLSVINKKLWYAAHVHGLSGRQLFTQISTNRMLLGGVIVNTPASHVVVAKNYIESFGWNFTPNQLQFKLRNQLGTDCHLALWIAYPLLPGQLRKSNRYVMCFTTINGSFQAINLNSYYLSSFGITATSNLHYNIRVKLINSFDFSTEQIFHCIDLH
jgi:hypothetical protein